MEILLAVTAHHSLNSTILFMFFMFLLSFFNSFSPLSKLSTTSRFSCLRLPSGQANFITGLSVNYHVSLRNLSLVYSKLNCICLREAESSSIIQLNTKRMTWFQSLGD